MHVGAHSFDPDTYNTVGGIIQNSMYADCMTHDTYGDIRNYNEIVFGSSGLCVVGTSPVQNETHTYRAQRYNEGGGTQCPSSAQCVANFIDGDVKQINVFSTDTFGAVEVAGELVRDTGTWWDSNTKVRGSFPGAGSTFWQRTSDPYVVGGDHGTFTTIGSAQCGEDNDATSHHGHLGAISGGFDIYFQFTDPAGQCP